MRLIATLHLRTGVRVCARALMCVVRVTLHLLAGVHICVRALMCVALGGQLTASDLQPYLGDSPRAVAARKAMGDVARARMQQDFACERLPAFVQSVTTVLDAAYPPWFKDLFFSPTFAQY